MSTLKNKKEFMDEIKRIDRIITVSLIPAWHVSHTLSAMFHGHEYKEYFEIENKEEVINLIKLVCKNRSGVFISCYCDVLKNHKE